MAGKVEGRESMQSVREPRVGELVADAASFGGRDDEAALAQTGQVVRQVGPSGAEPIGELGGIAGSVEEVHEDAPASRVRERSADPTEGREVDAESGYSHDLTIQPGMYAARGSVGRVGPGPVGRAS
jgi:hypothetical protein